nr:murein biosynthesis integral membrane protein MurJ [Desulfobacterales bacterium]
MSDNYRITRAASIVGTATLVSRIFGFVRDVVIAWFFGAGLTADAFFVAFRIPNLLRRLFAEGSLTVSFIPIFSEYLTRNGKEEAFRLARSACVVLSLFLTVVTLLGILLAPIIVHVIAPGFSETSEKLALTVILTRIMFPYIFFIAMVALFMGILNAMGHFAAPALAPVLLNLAMIASVFLVSPFMEQPVIGLAIGVIIGGCLQLALQFPFLFQKGFRFRGSYHLFHPAIKRIAALMGPSVFGAAVYQLNIFIGTLLASLLPEGSVSYLYYADRLVQFPLGVFAIALATAVLPVLSREAALNDIEGLKNTFSFALRLVFFISIPATVGLIVLKDHIVRLLFERGAFNSLATHMTSEALLYYALGLWSFSAVRILVSMFYSLQDARTPVKTAVISLFVNIVLSILLMGPMRHAGLALATSLSSMVNLSLMIAALKRRFNRIGFKDILHSMLKSITSSIVMGLILVVGTLWLIPENGIGSISLLAWVACSIGVGILCYTGCCLVLKSEELYTIINMLKDKWLRSFT